MPTATIYETPAAAEAIFQEIARRNRKEWLPLAELCQGMKAGYAAEHSMHDDGMVGMAEEVTSQSAELLRGLQALELLPNLVQSLQMACERVKQTNKEGDPILSAWLPDAGALIERARVAGLI